MNKRLIFLLVFIGFSSFYAHARKPDSIEVWDLMEIMDRETNETFPVVDGTFMRMVFPGDQCLIVLSNCGTLNCRYISENDLIIPRAHKTVKKECENEILEKILTYFKVNLYPNNVLKDRLANTVKFEKANGSW